MGVGAPGLGGGPSQPPDLRETEAQAYTEFSKMQVGMQPEGFWVVIPFTQEEYDAVFKYKAESDHPTLHPLLQLRGSNLGGVTVEDDSWKPIYQELLEALPEEIQEWLKWEMNQPFEDRDPGYVVLNNTLIWTAKSEAWLSAVTQPKEENDESGI